MRRQQEFTLGARRTRWLLAALVVVALAIAGAQWRASLAQTAEEIQLGKEVTDGSVLYGEEVEFTITIENTADGAAAEGSIAITDEVPELSGVVATPADGAVYSCDVTDTTVTCSNSEGAHADGATHSITITGSADVPGAHTNEVTGSYDDGEGEDPLESASEDFTIVASSVAVAKTVEPATVEPGDDLTFTITVTNEGDFAVDAPEGAVVITDALPGVLEDVEVTGDNVYDCEYDELEHEVVCMNDDEEAGSNAHVVDAEHEITITATVASDAADEDYANDATGEVTSQPDDASPTAPFTVASLRSIQISKWVEGDDAPALEAVTGTISPHTPGEWTILSLPGSTIIEDVSTAEQAITETNVGVGWDVDYAVLEDGSTCEGLGDDDWGDGPAIVPAGDVDYLVCIRNTWTVEPEPDVRTYTLYFRWSLFSWLSPDMSIGDALRGEGQSAGGTNVLEDVTAIYTWDGPNQQWLAFFPEAIDSPGVNDIDDFEFGRSYWVAIEGPDDVAWDVVEREAEEDETPAE